MKFTKTLYGAGLIILLWYLLHFLVQSAFVPSPHKTAAALWELLQEGLLKHIGASLLRLVAALLIALVIGVPWGILVGMNKKADEIISPAAYILYPIPKIAFLPVLMLLFGLGNASKIILIIIIIVFPIVLGARDGIKEIEVKYFYAMQSLGLNKAQIYRHLVFPAVLPKIVSALRVSIGISISVLFFAENFATQYGMGYFIMNTWAVLKYEEMFAGIVALSLIGLIVFKLIDYLERKLCPWLFL